MFLGSGCVAVEFGFGPKVCEPAPQAIGQSMLLQHEARYANNNKRAWGRNNQFRGWD
jgi:hypothetical protein